MIDTIAINELQLYIDNDYDLYNQMKYIAKGIKKAIEKDKYNDKQATNACLRLVRLARIEYSKEFGNFELDANSKYMLAVDIKENILRAIEEQEF